MMFLTETFAETEAHHGPLVWAAQYSGSPSAQSYLGNKPVLRNSGREWVGLKSPRKY